MFEHGVLGRKVGSKGFLKGQRRHQKLGVGEQGRQATKSVWAGYLFIISQLQAHCLVLCSVRPGLGSANRISPDPLPAGFLPMGGTKRLGKSGREEALPSVSSPCRPLSSNSNSSCSTLRMLLALWHQAHHRPSGELVPAGEKGAQVSFTP